jgi:hypothetical protein
MPFSPGRDNHEKTRLPRQRTIDERLSAAGPNRSHHHDEEEESGGA